MAALAPLPPTSTYPEERGERSELKLATRALLRKLPQFSCALVFTPDLPNIMWELSPGAGRMLEAISRGQRVEPARAEPLTRVGLVAPVEGQSGCRPRFLSAVDEAMHEGSSSRLGFPLRLEMDLLDHCNLKCIHCRTDAQPEHSNLMGLELAARLITEAAAGGAFWLTFSGGEPTLHPDLGSILQLARRLSPWKISVATNGVDRTSPGARALLESEIDEIVVSLDGLRATHEAVRGHGSFDATMAFLGDVSASGKSLHVNTVVTAAIIDELPALCAMLQAVGANGMTLSLPFPTGRAVQSMPVGLSRALMTRLRLAISDLKQVGFRVRLNDFPTCNMDAPEGLLQDALSGCYAGRWSCYVDAGGVVRGCKMTPEQVVGEVNDRSLREMWLDAGSYGWFRARRAALAKTECADCAIVQWCGGGCPAMGAPLRTNRDQRCRRRSEPRQVDAS